MHHRRHHHFVSLGQEAWRDHADDQVLGGRGSRHGDAGLGVVGEGARGEAPGGQRIRVVHRDAPAALGIGDQIADPVDGIGEVFADFGLHFLVAFEVGEGERAPALAGQLQAIASGIAREVVLAREHGVHPRILAAVEVANRVGRVVGLDAVDRLVDHGQADLRAHRCAGLIGHENRERARLTRL